MVFPSWVVFKKSPKAPRLRQTEVMQGPSTSSKSGRSSLKVRMINPKKNKKLLIRLQRGKNLQVQLPPKRNTYFCNRDKSWSLLPLPKNAKNSSNTTWFLLLPDFIFLRSIGFLQNPTVLPLPPTVYPLGRAPGGTSDLCDDQSTVWISHCYAVGFWMFLVFLCFCYVLLCDDFICSFVFVILAVLSLSLDKFCSSPARVSFYIFFFYGRMLGLTYINVVGIQSLIHLHCSESKHRDLNMPEPCMPIIENTCFVASCLHLVNVGKKTSNFHSPKFKQTCHLGFPF